MFGVPSANARCAIKDYQLVLFLPRTSKKTAKLSVKLKAGVFTLDVFAVCALFNLDTEMFGLNRRFLIKLWLSEYFRLDC